MLLCPNSAFRKIRDQYITPERARARAKRRQSRRRVKNKSHHALPRRELAACSVTQSCGMLKVGRNHPRGRRSTRNRHTGRKRRIQAQVLPAPRRGQRKTEAWTKQTAMQRGRHNDSNPRRNSVHAAVVVSSSVGKSYSRAPGGAKTSAK